MFKHLNKDGLIYFWGKVKSYVSNQLLNYYTKTQTNAELGKKANSVHSHSNATTTTAGYMSYPDKSKLDSISAGANKYVHPNFTARGTDLYKVSVDSQGHVNTVTVATKDDITKLGIPAQDTTYSAVTTTVDGLMIAADKVKLNTIATNANNYSHPTRTAIGEGIYKASFDTAGHIATAVPITKTDITALDIPAQDTTYGLATVSANGLMPATDKAKIDKINTPTSWSFTATAAGWTATAGMYVQEINLSGMETVYEPSFILQTSETDSTKKQQIENMFIREIETRDGSVRLVALEKPAIDLPIKLVI